jgi:hypothetical protein
VAPGCGYESGTKRKVRVCLAEVGGVDRELQNEPNSSIDRDQHHHLVEFIDENGGGPGVRLRTRQQKKT